ncbi:MAG: KH domain-containing protein, partial [Promethearchaeia archaeon]
MYFKVEFAVNGEHMGMVIGTNGNNIKKAQAIPGVHLIEVTRENKVIIYADKREQADAARELLEIIHSRVPVDSSEIGYIIG